MARLKQKNMDPARPVSEMSNAELRREINSFDAPGVNPFLKFGERARELSAELNRREAARKQKHESTN
jgi:hypothetical protein